MEDQGGAPKWMVTFGDALTLLLTFFVLLLTYSTPNEEDLSNMSRGFFGKQGPSGSVSEDSGSSVATQPSLLNPPSQSYGTQLPPLYRKLKGSKLSSLAPGMSILKPPEVKKTIVIRIPIARIFNSENEISPAGERLLKRIGNVIIAFPRVIVIRSRASMDRKSRPTEESNLTFSLKLIDKLKSGISGEEYEFNISPDIQLLDKELPNNYCELIIMQN